jgi:hypothetical protein
MNTPTINTNGAAKLLILSDADKPAAAIIAVTLPKPNLKARNRESAGQRRAEKMA